MANKYLKIRIRPINVHHKIFSTLTQFYAKEPTQYCNVQLNSPTIITELPPSTSLFLEDGILKYLDGTAAFAGTFFINIKVKGGTGNKENSFFLKET